MKEILITEENFQDIEPKLLLDPQRYEDIEVLVISILAGGSGDEAKECASILADKLSIIGEGLSKDLQKKYINLLKVLKLIALKSLSDLGQENFFAEQILDIFKIDFIDVKEQIGLVFSSYFEASDIIENLRGLFLKGLEKNQELLGQGNIKITISGEVRMVKPSLQNWLFDYNTSVHINKELKKRAGYEQINYATGSLNVRTLDKENRDVLLKVIQLYDWLKFDPLKYDFRLPGQPSWQEDVIDVDSPQKYIPDDLIQSIEKFRAKRPAQDKNNQGTYAKSQKLELPQEVLSPKVPPVVPVPKNLPEQREMGDVAVESGEQTLNEPITSPLHQSSNSGAGQASPSLERRGMGAGAGTLRVDRTDRSDMANMAGGSAPQTFNRVNFQDVLKNRDQEVGIRNQGDAVTGLRMGGGGKIPNDKYQISNKGTGDKNSPGPSLEKRGEETRSSPSSYILNPLLEKKPVVPQSGQAKQEEIDRKLEELKKKIK
jgi:hypothetical protein